MDYKPISDYGVIGDMHSAALAGADGSIDSGVPLGGNEVAATASFRLRQGEPASFVLRWGGEPAPEQRRHMWQRSWSRRSPAVNPAEMRPNQGIGRHDHRS